MQMSGEQRVDAPRQKVWEALNDPEVLRASIPGCQTLDKEGDDRFVATVEVKIGPIGARFKGGVQLADLDPANGYMLIGEGSAGIAGSAKGSARVRLSDADGGGTLVSYDVDSQVSGRLAQLGGPIIDATAKQLAGKFFARFGEVVGAASATPAATAPVSPGAPAFAEAALAAPAPIAPAPAYAPVTGSGIAPLWGWIAALVVALMTGFVVGQLGPFAVVLLMMVILMIVTAAAAFAAGRWAGRGRGA